MNELPVETNGKLKIFLYMLPLANVASDQLISVTLRP